MAITDFPIFNALRTKMRWHQSRQNVLAENVANADTPGFRGRDLKALDFSKAQEATLSGVSARRTHTAHIAAGSASAGARFGGNKPPGFEITPDGNEVVLEEQMMKIAANQLDYQAATMLYSRSLNLIRTATRSGG